VYIEGPFHMSNSKWLCFALHAAFDLILAQPSIARNSDAMAAVTQLFNALCNCDLDLETHRTNYSTLYDPDSPRIVLQTPGIASISSF
jgi:hypothetical protein